MFNTQNNNESEEDYNTSRRLVMLSIMTVILGASRLLTLEFLMLLSDLLTALMVYFFACSKTKCTAIFCMINGVVGIVYAIMRVSPAVTAAKISWFNLYQSLLVVIAIYALVVYSLICYYALVGIFKYEMGFSGFGMPSRSQQGYNVSSNYGAISTDANTNSGFKAFSGKGVTFGSV